MNSAYRTVILCLVSVACGTFAAGTATATTETVLYRFSGYSDGAYPYAGLIADNAGGLYGTTYEGGRYGYGAVFKLAPPGPGHPTWRQTVLYNFCSQSACNDGSYPRASLISDQRGALYGTTYEGGKGGTGTVFKLTPPPSGQTTWTEAVIHNFYGDDFASYPVAGLTLDPPGSDAQATLYGTTEYGGYGPFSTGYGTIFKLTPPAPGHTHWTSNRLYTFCSVGYYCNDGANPVGRLVADSSGALYGTTTLGGSTGGNGINCLSIALSGCGTVFKLTPPANGATAWTHTVLYSFCPQNLCYDGQNPVGGLIIGKGGVLFGTTSGGGLRGLGTVFALIPGPAGWTETVIHSFGWCPWRLNPSCPSGEGASPLAGLISDGAGNLYGTTIEATAGQNLLQGTVFMLTPIRYPVGWVETVLHTFTGVPDGGRPVAGLVEFQGALYGTTRRGGTGCNSSFGGCGTVFKVAQ